MNEIMHTLATLRRPRILIRAARIGAADYRREAHLRRYLGQGRLPRSDAALSDLVEMEAALENQRREDNAGYSASRHVDILIAMMGEARMLRAITPQPVT
ncbi:hypothetical protein G5B38_01995 [Pseudohalocynthiibacter aestuariivivens]|uniref:DUF6477 family protein n=1 Tax=Roseovarius pelagicus TaxID=2980108 RepID=A0ABY6DFD4_9RHOB|nr:MULTISPECIES: DUF6477 family protein [Rhodobacterales]QIE44399.1 hypothetical protein G5B38_01995 [Pseudohalocynthiibacter aestuariivivens]UXX83683.1 DUF6477 family protein [Roseovarius pelagicus]